MNPLLNKLTFLNRLMGINLLKNNEKTQNRLPLDKNQLQIKTYN